MSEDNNSNSLSIDDIVRELDREETNIVISKEIKKFNKPTTVVRGLGERKDIQSIARDLKTKLGTSGTYKDGQVIFNAIQFVILYFSKRQMQTLRLLLKGIYQIPRSFRREIAWRVRKPIAVQCIQK
jgi:translation initiation factor 1